jgi:DNA-binding winged helix-turn-helix (wHTH) protein
VGAQARELDMLRAFEAGADDFLARPATYLELRARVRAILRRTADVPGRERLIEVGPLAIDAGAHAVTVEGRDVDLRRMEFELLVHLARDPERVFAKDELLRAVWEYRCGGSTRTVDSHASRLRRKLAPGGARRWVINVWGVGYRLIRATATARATRRSSWHANNTLDGLERPGRHSAWRTSAGPAGTSPDGLQRPGRHSAQHPDGGHSGLAIAR